MNLHKFKPRNWIVEVCSILPDKSLALDDRESFETLEQAQEYAARMSNGMPDAGTQVITRPANPRDHAAQRLEEIGCYIADMLERTLLDEADILAYDMGRYGRINFAYPILNEIESMLENYPPEEETPYEMGWVGGDGQP